MRTEIGMRRRRPRLAIGGCSGRSGPNRVCICIRIRYVRFFFYTCCFSIALVVVDWLGLREGTAVAFELVAVVEVFAGGGC